VCFECRFWEVEEFLLQWSSLNLRRFTMVGSQMETNMIRGSSDSRYLQKFRLYETRSVCTWITRSLFFNCYPYVVEFVGFCFSFFCVLRFMICWFCSSWLWFLGYWFFSFLFVCARVRLIFSVIASLKWGILKFWWFFWGDRLHWIWFAWCWI
jgi:hypothetical protein